jgi:hypothetical protein
MIIFMSMVLERYKNGNLKTLKPVKKTRHKDLEADKIKTNRKYMRYTGGVDYGRMQPALCP